MIRDVCVIPFYVCVCVCGVRGWVSACLCVNLVYQGSMAATFTVCHISRSNTQKQTIFWMSWLETQIISAASVDQPSLTSTPSQGLTLAVASTK